MRESERMTQLLVEISQSEHIDEGNIVATSELISRTICNGLSITRSSVWLMNEDKSDLTCIYALNNNQEECINYESETTDINHYFSEFKNGISLALETQLNQLITPDYVAAYIKQRNVGSLLDAIVYRNGKKVGIIRAEYTKTNHSWRKEDESFLIHLTNVLSRTLISKELHQIKNKQNKVHQVLQNTQDEMIKLEKMATLGNLVAGVTHEINTPIGIGVTTVSHLEYLTKQIEQEFNAGSITEKHFNTYLQSANEACLLLMDNLTRAANLIKSFKQVAVDQTDDSLLQIDLHDTLKNITNSVRPELHKKYQTKVEFKCEPGIYLRTCPGSIAQVITNLLINAGIHAFDHSQKDRQVTVQGEMKHQHIIITVTDNGSGIEQALQPKIFDPFVTTKRGQGGSGLGLNIVQTLVTQKLKGSISLESVLGELTRFTIYLPNQAAN